MGVRVSHGIASKSALRFELVGLIEFIQRSRSVQGVTSVESDQLGGGHEQHRATVGAGKAKVVAGQLDSAAAAMVARTRR